MKEGRNELYMLHQNIPDCLVGRCLNGDLIAQNIPEIHFKNTK